MKWKTKLLWLFRSFAFAFALALAHAFEQAFALAHALAHPWEHSVAVRNDALELVIFTQTILDLILLCEAV